jgi:hypothetical protein
MKGSDMIACGLDFGTSNSAIGIVRGDAVALAPLEDDKTLMPSAVFFDYEAHRVLFGSDAIAAYAGQTEGRLMRALKTILGSPLIDEKTSLGSRMVALTEVVGIFVRHLKHKAEAFAGQEITAVVHGRPVHFVDSDAEADARAQAVLETIARQAGFNHVVFVPEPIAAAWHYEQTVQAEQLVLIADIGGGTSDFSVVRIGPQRRGRIDRSGDILATAGVRIGGTDFDSALSLAAVMPLLGLGTRLVEKDLPMPNALYHELANWATINFAYTYKNERAGKGRTAPGGDRQAPRPPRRLLGRGRQDRAQRRTRCRHVPRLRRAGPCRRGDARRLRAGDPHEDRSAVQDGPRLHRRGGPRRCGDRHRLPDRRLEPRAGRARGDCRGGTGGTAGDGLGPAVRRVGLDADGGADGLIRPLHGFWTIYRSYYKITNVLRRSKEPL